MRYFSILTRYLNTDDLSFESKLYIFVIFTIAISIYGFFINKYSYHQEHIICNDFKCEIQHINLKKNIVVKTDKFDIKNIKNFEAKYMKRYYYLYAIYNDGKSKRVSPCYISSRQTYRHIIDEPVKYLNEAIRKNPVNIDLLFPDNSYFPEYIKK